jgi:hypothetical protein
MPPKNEAPHGHLKPAPRRRSKPKFEMPVDTMRPEAPVAWVYRADEVALLKKPQPAAAPVHGREDPRREDREEPGALLIAGMVMIALSTGAVGLVSLAALNFSAIPFRIAKRLLIRD